MTSADVGGRRPFARLFRTLLVCSSVLLQEQQGVECRRIASSIGGRALFGGERHMSGFGGEKRSSLRLTAKRLETGASAGAVQPTTASASTAAGVGATAGAGASTTAPASAATGASTTVPASAGAGASTTVGASTAGALGNSTAGAAGGNSTAVVSSVSSTGPVVAKTSATSSTTISGVPLSSISIAPSSSSTNSGSGSVSTSASSNGTSSKNTTRSNTRILFSRFNTSNATLDGDRCGECACISVDRRAAPQNRRCPEENRFATTLLTWGDGVSLRTQCLRECEKYNNSTDKNATTKCRSFQTQSMPPNCHLLNTSYNATVCNVSLSTLGWGVYGMTCPWDKNADLVFWKGVPSQI
ncbi:unnamed protein product [Amoebophrya sp. A25]|nr:unnamed protein product [Amoebophrya sp. A25]|eukprot:GSA25T00009293001.1